MFTMTAAAVLVAMLLTLIRAIKGPSIYDRVLAVNMFATKTTILIVVMGFLTGRPDFTDIALVYPLLGFITAIAILKFFEIGDLGDSGPASVGRPRGED